MSVSVAKCSAWLLSCTAAFLLLWAAIGSGQERAPGTTTERQQRIQRAVGPRVACTTIIREVDSERRRAPSQLVEITDIGRKLNQDLRWVERCMRLYGRRPLKPAPLHAESKEEEEEEWESDEPVEIGVEETGDARDGEQQPERQRVLRIKPTPTPDPLRFDEQQVLHQ
jgi:hypothetical protein